MKVINTNIEGLVVIQPKVYEDNRGYFMESYRENFIKNRFSGLNFIQDNESSSSFGVLRGLHFQKSPYAQTKLVRVIKGKVLDVAVDLRKKSKTFGFHYSIELSDENKKQLLIPKGFAHGFIVLTKNAVFSYKVDNIYNSKYDSGIKYDDPILNIDWKIDKKYINVSEKDESLQSFKKFKSNIKI